jgi:hypothetical protein
VVSHPSETELYYNIYFDHFLKPVKPSCHDPKAWKPKCNCFVYDEGAENEHVCDFCTKMPLIHFNCEILSTISVSFLNLATDYIYILLV